MAEGGISLDVDELCCAICLHLLKDPVTSPCGHSFCIGCIKGYWNQDDHTGVYNCPQCRQTFTPRPVLGINTTLAEVVRKEEKKGPGEVACDFCTQRKRKAIKSCLVCLASYCEIHLQPHYESPAFEKHKLVKAAGNMEEKICPHHNKLLEVYCRTDQQCICPLCVMDEHKGHHTVSAEVERNEKQKQLGVTQSKFQQKIQDREKECQDLRQAVFLFKHSAQAAVEDSERIFTELIHSMKRRRTKVKELIRAQEKAEVSRAEELLERLELEIAELRRRDNELKQLSDTDDHIQVLQFLDATPSTEDLSSITINLHVSFEAASKSLSILKERLEDVFKGELLTITESVKEIAIQPIPQPTLREEFLQYYCHLTLDPDTAHAQLSLSEGNRELTRLSVSQSYPEHPARFDYWEQVLCRDGLSGRHYWEVERSGTGNVYIAVSYEGIIRKGWGHNALLGYNDKSWSLWCSRTKCYHYHNKKCTTLHAPTSSRIGVYLDHRAGTLSFYSVSDTMTLLHRVQTTFTRPLYPGFYANKAGSTIKLCSVGLE